MREKAGERQPVGVRAKGQKALNCLLSLYSAVICSVGSCHVIGLSYDACMEMAGLWHFAALQKHGKTEYSSHQQMRGWNGFGGSGPRGSRQIFSIYI